MTPVPLRAGDLEYIAATGIPEPGHIRNRDVIAIGHVLGLSRVPPAYSSVIAAVALNHIRCQQLYRRR